MQQQIILESPGRMEPVDSKAAFLDNEVNLNIYRVEGSGSGGSEESVI